VGFGGSISDYKQGKEGEMKKMKDEHFILLLVWVPFIFCLIGSFLPDPLLVLNIAPDFGMEKLITIPNIFRYFLGVYLHPLWICLSLGLTILLLDERRNKKRRNESE